MTQSANHRSWHVRTLITWNLIIFLDPFSQSLQIQTGKISFSVLLRPNHTFPFWVGTANYFLYGCWTLVSEFDQKKYKKPLRNSNPKIEFQKVNPFPHDPKLFLRPSPCRHTEISWQKTISCCAFHIVEIYLSESYEQQIYITISNQFRKRKQLFILLRMKPQFSLAANRKAWRWSSCFTARRSLISISHSEATFKLDLSNCF